MTDKPKRKYSKKPMPEGYISAVAAAAELGISFNTLKNWLADVQTMKLPKDRRVYYPISEIEKIKARLQEPTK